MWEPLEHLDHVVTDHVDLDYLWKAPWDAEEQDYIWPTWLAGSAVCAWTVTGSLLIGSPHRLVLSCFRSAVLFLRQVDGCSAEPPSCDIYA